MMNLLKKAQYTLQKLNYKLQRKLAERSYSRSATVLTLDDNCWDWTRCSCTQCYMDRWETFIGDDLNPDRRR